MSNDEITIITLEDPTKGRVLTKNSRPNTTGTGTVPTGGTAGQVLRKTSSTDYDDAWRTLSTADIVASTDKNFISDAGLVILGNTSGINSGDQDLSGLALKSTTINGHPLSSDITLTAEDLDLTIIDGGSSTS